MSLFHFVFMLMEVIYFHSLIELRYLNALITVYFFFEASLYKKCDFACIYSYLLCFFVCHLPQSNQRIARQQKTKQKKRYYCKRATLNLRQWIQEFRLSKNFIWKCERLFCVFLWSFKEYIKLKWKSFFLWKCF